MLDTGTSPRQALQFVRGLDFIYSRARTGNCNIGSSEPPHPNALIPGRGSKDTVMGISTSLREWGLFGLQADTEMHAAISSF